MAGAVQQPAVEIDVFCRYISALVWVKTAARLLLTIYDLVSGRDFPTVPRPDAPAGVVDLQGPGPPQLPQIGPVPTAGIQLHRPQLFRRVDEYELFGDLE